MKSFTRSFLVLTLLVVALASVSQAQETTSDSTPVVSRREVQFLNISNDGANVIKVSDNGRLVARLNAGETRCLFLQAAGTHRLEFAFDFPKTGKLTLFTPTGEPAGWRMRVVNLSTDERASLYPLTGNPCSK